MKEIRELIVRMASENSSGGYARRQGASCCLSTKQAQWRVVSSSLVGRNVFRDEGSADAAGGKSCLRYGRGVLKGLSGGLP